MADREQLALFAPAAGGMSEGGGRQQASCDTSRGGVLFTRGCSSRLRGGLRRYCQDNEISSEAQGTRILLAKALRRAGYM
ncbi:MAG: hypothetical protein KC636_26050 [Myxococcales bacterium]|nr:hypothetical protein [Myxococcales bacterium]